ncbi:MAG: hypothetical protein GY944_24825, partial [bacterium]|nr:hypothetical protein [bacterium]
MASNAPSTSTDLSFPDQPANSGGAAKPRSRNNSRNTEADVAGVAPAADKRPSSCNNKKNNAARVAEVTRTKRARTKKAPAKTAAKTRDTASGEVEAKATAKKLPTERGRVRKAAPRANAKSRDDAAALRDPVRVYLREMGRVSLLTREGEVEIAKRIESATHDATFAVLGNAWGIEAVLELGDRFRAGDVGLRRVVDGLDDANAEPKEKRRRQFLQALGTIKKLRTEIEGRRRSIANTRRTRETRTRLRKENDADYQKMLGRLRKVRLARTQFEEFAGWFRELSDAFSRLDGRAQMVVRPFMMSVEEFGDLAKRAGGRGA